MKRMQRSVSFLAIILLLNACTATRPPIVQPGPAGSVQGFVTSDGAPLPGATVTVTGEAQPKRSAVTNAQGQFAILGLQPGTYTVRAELQGLQTITRQVTLTAGQGVSLVADLRVSAVTESITVTAEAPQVSGPSMTFSGATVNAGLRGNSGTSRAFVAATTAPAPPSEPPPLQPQYTAITEHAFIETNQEATATFAIDVDRASYANMRHYLNQKVLPPPEAVRIEEMVNYFRYSYPQPEGDRPFSVTTEVAGCPWNTENRLVRVGIQGRQLDQWKMAPNNLVFLIDVSGSMSSGERLPLLKQAFEVLVQELRAEDRVAIVVYAGAAGLVLRSTSGADKRTILDAIDKLEAGGSTAGGAGIELAYKIAKENFLESGNNRVILATDGDFNVGPMTTLELESFIEQKRGTGVFLSVLGVGTNAMDATMETLADKGNGNYTYLDTVREAESVFRSGLTGTLVTIAQDVKVQLEFDPAAVQSYRQIGYENRALAKEDFADDKKDAGELGAGHSVTALFEIVPARGASRGRIAELRLRWKEPRGEVSQPLVTEIVDEGKSAYEASDDMQFAAAVAEMGMLLRNSPHSGDASWDDVLHLARISQGADLDGTREEFLKMARAAKRLK